VSNLTPGDTLFPNSSLGDSRGRSNEVPSVPFRKKATMTGPLRVRAAKFRHVARLIASAAGIDLRCAGQLLCYNRARHVELTITVPTKSYEHERNLLQKTQAIDLIYLA